MYVQESLLSISLPYDSMDGKYECEDAFSIYLIRYKANKGKNFMLNPFFMLFYLLKWVFKQRKISCLALFLGEKAVKRLLISSFFCHIVRNT